VLKIIFRLRDQQICLKRNPLLVLDLLK